jgi:predicted Zn-dependent protease
VNTLRSWTRAAALLLLAACSTVRPPEGDLRKLTRIYESGLFERVEEYPSRELQGYLVGLVRRLDADAFARAGVEPRVRIRLDPSPLASVYPHGLIVVNSGLLALVESEAQLAAVLAHEIAHFRGRDFVRNERAELYLQNAGLALGFVGGVAIATLADPTGTASSAGGQLASQAGRLGFALGQRVAHAYSRKLERDADRTAIEILEAASFPGSAMYDVLSLFEQRAPELAEVPGVSASFHPSMHERVELLRARYAADTVHSATPASPRELYPGATPLFAKNALMDCSQRRFARGRRTLERALEASPGDPRVLFATAECLRKQDPDGPDLQAQIDAYRAAAEAAPEEPESLAQLGMLYRRLGRREEAIAAFQAYIERAPDTPEAAIFAGYIARLQIPTTSVAGEP